MELHMIVSTGNGQLGRITGIDTTGGMVEITTNDGKKYDFSTNEVYRIDRHIRNRCWFCGGEMIWGGDFSFEDYGKDGEGIVANLSCSECGAYAEYTTPEEDEL